MTFPMRWLAGIVPAICVGFVSYLVVGIGIGLGCAESDIQDSTQSDAWCKAFAGTPHARPGPAMWAVILVPALGLLVTTGFLAGRKRWFGVAAWLAAAVLVDLILVMAFGRSDNG
jgi:hypothetical protein